MGLLNRPIKQQEGSGKIALIDERRHPHVQAALQCAVGHELASTLALPIIV